MTGALRLLLAAALAAAGAGPAPHPAAGRERSPAIYPEREVAIAFSHRRHRGMAGRCLACHSGALTSDSVRDRLVPGERDCTGCHDVDGFRKGLPTDPPAGCHVCHPGFDHAVQPAPRPSFFPPANLRFSHVRHLERLGAAGEERSSACAACHGDVEAVDLAGRGQLPAMASCLACHDGRQASADCATCHLLARPGAGARLETVFPGGQLRPGPGNPLGLDHGPRYDLTHSLAAASRRGQCLACHAESSCLGCHDATRKPDAVHPGDFASTHPVAARQGQPRCSACHRVQSFCTGCHERAGVGPEADVPGTGFYAGAAVHPPGWLVPGPKHHGVQAARNVAQCAACHREEGCLRCHATTSPVHPGGVLPHPPGFAARCREMLAKNDRGCRKCHDLSDPADRAARCR